MDKQTKSLLKEARDAIRTGDYQLAQSKAENVLNLDGVNYNALVFAAVAAQELKQEEKAEKWFRMAIATNPDVLLAWQGWSSFCEKSNDQRLKAELAETYRKLMQLHTDHGKQFEAAGKLAQFYLEKKEIEKTLEVLEKQLEIAAGDELKERRVNEAVVKVLTHHDSISKEQMDLLKSSLKKLLANENLLGDEERKCFIEEYVTILVKENQIDECVQQVNKLLEIDSEAELGHRVICTLFTISIANDETLELGDVPSSFTKLLTLNEKNEVARVAEIAFLLKSGNNESLMTRLAFIDSANSPDECLILTRACELIHQYQKATKFAREGLNQCKKLSRTDKISNALQICHLKNQLQIASREEIDQNILRLEEIFSSSQSIDVFSLLAKSYLKTDQIKAAKNLFNSSCGNTEMADAFMGIILLQENELRLAKTKLENGIEKYPNESEFKLQLALVLRNMGDYGSSLKCLLTALKDDPYNPSLFLQIGYHYRLIGDAKKAERCFKKSFLINPDDEEVSIALSDVYNELKMDEENYLFLESLIKRRRSKWALIRFGLLNYKRQSLAAAIKALQGALSIDSTDNHCWEALADCYLARGSYGAALKSYAKVLELCPDSMYSCFQMAKIRQLIHEYTEAITEYKRILAIEPNYIPALKGYGEVKLLQAVHFWKECLPGLTRDCWEKAIQIFSKAVSLQPNLVCLWKSLGDSLTFARNVSPESCNIDIPEILMHICGVKGETVNQIDLLQMGAMCYRKALTFHENNSELWHDLSINYHYQGWFSQSMSDKASCYMNALITIKKAVSMNADDFEHWNVLGIVAARLKDFSLAQHAFINSINVENNNVVAWTNLGLIYFINDNIELAHQAFSVAQTIDPSYINCWLGMAMIAETVGHAEAMDLFRHTAGLGYHGESALGYSHWIIETLLRNDIDQKTKLQCWKENMATLPTPPDCMVKFTGRIEKDPLAWNLLGLLLEIVKLYCESSKAFEKSLALLMAEGDAVKIDLVRSNYARVLSSRKQFKIAAEQFIQIKEPDFSSQCGLALCLYQNGCYQESYQAYEAALHWFAKTDEEKSHVNVAMAIAAFKMNDIENAKTLLFQSSQLEPPSMHGILALYAIGLLQSDFVLVEAAFKEVIPYTKKADYVHNVILIAFTGLLQGKTKLAQRVVSKAIREFPWKLSLWELMSRVLLQFDHGRSAYLVDKCVSVILTGNSTQEENVSVYKVASLRNMAHLANGSISECLKSAQKALHLNPSDPSNWAGLIASAVMRDGNYKAPKSVLWFDRWLNFAVENSSSLLQPWFHWYKCLKSLSLKLFDEARSHLRKATVCNLQENKININVLRWLIDCITSGEIVTDQLQSLLIQNPDHCFGWQILVNSYLITGNYLNAIEISNYWKNLADEHCFPIAELAASLSICNISLNKYKTEKNKELILLAEKTTAEAKKISSCIALYFLMAKIHHFKGDQKKQKNILQLIQQFSESYGWTMNVAKSILPAAEQ